MRPEKRTKMTDKKPTLYLAGRMRALPDIGRAAFHEAEAGAMREMAGGRVPARLQVQRVRQIYRLDFTR